MSAGPMWTQLSEMAERLAGASHGVALADLKTLRAAALTLEGWFTAAQELIAERDQARTDAAKYREALLHIQATLQLAQRFAGLEACELDNDTFSRDMAGHMNIMAAHGDPDYQKGALSCRHVDMRSAAPKKARKAAK